MRLPRFYNRLNRQLGDSSKCVRPYMVDNKQNQKQKMNMDEININVLRELQEYAQLYFESIVELNTVDGKCTLKPGKYSAKDMQDNSHKSVFGHYYPLPEDSIYDEVITIKCGTFECEFPYRRIFTILTRWETMCKAGKLKAIFEIGEFEEKSAKVLINDRTMLGAFKTKTMKLQRIAGNWWGIPKEIRKEGEITGYYELNGVMFAPGKTFYGNPRDDANKVFTDRFDDAKISELLVKYISDESHKECDIYEYYIEVISQAGIDTTTEEAKAIAEAAIEERRKRDEEGARELAERKVRTEEALRERMEEEERIKRKMAESLAKAKENFLSGKMISCNDFERIAESVDYGINIRTLGTLRKRVSWVEVDSEGTPTVYGTKRRQGLDGTFDIIRKVYEKLKAIAATANEPVKHISEIMETCRTWDDEKRDYTDEYKYYTWLANHIPKHKATNKNTTELILEEVRERISAAATLAAHGVPKCDIEGAVCAVVNRLAKVEDILQLYNRIGPPQPPETPRRVECTTNTPKPRETAQKRQNRTIGSAQAAQPRTIKNCLILADVPRQCSTICHFVGVSKMIAAPPDYAPPIRGDCKIRRSVRAESPYFPKTDQIRCFNPPLD